MAANSKIEWTETTWNVITGCTKVSEGCEHCYIERTPPFRMAGRRFDKPGVGGTTGLLPHHDRLDLPLTWRKPRRVFVNSLADLFHVEVPDTFIAEVFARMWWAPQHTFQVLTKRHARLRAIMPRIEENLRRREHDLALMDFPTPLTWPLPNVWVGVSVENQQWADIRIPALLETPAAVRWLSCEPLLGPVDLRARDTRTFGPRPLPAVAYGVNAPDQRAGDGSWIGALYEDMYGPNIDWVVVGGESGPGARPMHPDWVRGLRNQCTAAGVPFFFKQWGEWCHSEQMPEDTWRDLDAAINLAQMHPEPHRVGKKRAGRLLDGREWSEYPQAVSADA